MISIDGLWTEDEASDEDVVGFVRSTFDEVSQFGSGDVYLNFTGNPPARSEAPTSDSAFGRNLGRLAEVKAKYDPDNFFRVNQNISPAS